MSFLPIVGRELRVASRRRGTFINRVAAAGVAFLVAAWAFMAIGSNAWMRPQLGAMIFGTLTFFAFVYCLLIGARVTADCLSEEKRDGTLGLLFLTDLRGYDVVVGKLFATSLNAFYGLLAVFPVMAIPVLLGGVSGSELVRTVALLLNTMFFSLAVGMFASAVARHEFRALGLTVLLLFLITGLLPICGVWWMESFATRVPGVDRMPPIWTVLPSPAMSYAFLEDATMTNKWFWPSLAVTHGLSWALLGAACLILPRTWQERGKSARVERWERNSARLAYGNTGQRLARRRHLLDLHPIVWLCSRRRSDALALWAALVAGAVLWLGFAIRWPSDMFEEASYVMTAIFAHTAIKFWVASFAVRQIAEDRRTGALELLLATPLSHMEIARGHLRAVRRLFGGPLLVVLVVDVALSFACLYKGSSGSMPASRDNWMLFYLGIGSMGTLLADVWALGWLGLWFGLTTNRATRAFFASVWRVVYLPGIVMWFGGTCLLVGGGFGGSEPETALVIWFVLSFVNAGVWYAFAERRLTSEFRLAAARRFDAPKPGWIKRMFGRGGGAQPPPLPTVQ